MLIFDKTRDAVSAVRLGLNIREHRNNRINTEYDRRIRVAFIVQDPGVWEMQRSVFQSLRDNGIFNLCTVVAPPFNKDKGCIVNDYGNIEFYRRECKGVKIFRAMSKRGSVIDLKKYHFDYVFYDSSMDERLPKKLRSSIISGYAKTCFVRRNRKVDEIIPVDFLRNLYMVFSDSLKQIEDVYRKMWKPCRLPHHVNLIGNTAGYDIIKYLLKDFSGGGYDCP